VNIMVAGNRVVEIQCKQCLNIYKLLVNIKDLEDWTNGKGAIQDSLDYIPADHRELFISQICGTCFDKMYG
jgi:hypothetical protein